MTPALQKIARVVLTSLAPPPILTVSEWADRERVLSSESSAEPGKWSTSRTPYLKTVMDSVTDPTINRIVVCKASQVGWSETLNNVAGYYIAHDPCSILMIQPTLENAEAFSRDRIAPLIRDTPILRELVSDPLSRDNSNTLRTKTFPGGRLSLIGANSPASLASRPIRVILADEIDRYPVSAGSEGNPLSLAHKRTATFWNRRTLLGSTPTIRGASVIWREFENSDQRRFFVPCGECGHMQYLVWANVCWDKDESGKHLPETAHYACEGCGVLWTDADRNTAVQKGEWRATAEGAKGVAGFHIPALISPWVTMADIVREFLSARQDPSLLQVFVNTCLGECWEEASEKLEGSGLITRVEVYDRETIPAAARFLTAGVDVQADRLEMSVVGWAAHEESYLISHDIVLGDPVRQEVWAYLDALLLDRFTTDAGHEMRIRAACIDTGGPNMGPVLAFCKPRRARSILPTKGAPGPRPIWPKRLSRTHDNGTVAVIGVDTAKEMIYGRLRITKPGPGHVHFSATETDEEYFAQLASEKVVTKFRQGRSYREWISTRRRNEALDCFVLSLAARMALRIRLDAFRDPPPPPPVDQPDLEGGEDVSTKHSEVQAILAAKIEQAAARVPQPPSTGVKHSAFDSKPSWMDRRRW